MPAGEVAEGAGMDAEGARKETQRPEHPPAGGEQGEGVGARPGSCGAWVCPESRREARTSDDPVPATTARSCHCGHVIPQTLTAQAGRAPDQDQREAL